MTHRVPVGPVHFGSEARFEHDDLLLMIRSLRSLLDASPLDNWPPAATDRVTGALRWLLASGSFVGLPPARGVAGRSPRASSPSGDPETEQAELGQAQVGQGELGQGELGHNVLIDLPTERVLDHAASLLDASVMLHRGDLYVQAFALEGIQGRLLEAAVGVGSVERPW